MQQRIEVKVREALAPKHLEVTDETHMHNVSRDSESHFRLLVVSDRFEGQSLVERHRTVYEILADEMKDQIHALGLQTLTAAEWATSNVPLAESPECLGGGKVRA